ncbi:MAG: gamma-glutamylcyclotransferase family protein [Leeuwenhoekiella sp.]
MNTKREHRLFTYGTLQQSKIQRQLYGRILTQEAALLCGFGLKTIRIPDHPAGTEYPALEPMDDRNALVKGAILTLTPTELLQTDLYEGKSYKRVLTQTVAGIPCWVYILH